MVPRRLRENHARRTRRCDRATRLRDALKSARFRNVSNARRNGAGAFVRGPLRRGGALGREGVERLAELSHRRLHNCCEPCACWPNGRSAARDAQSTPARPRASPFQSQGLAAIPPAGISRHLVGRLATSRAAGMNAALVVGMTAKYRYCSLMGQGREPLLVVDAFGCLRSLRARSGA